MGRAFQDKTHYVHIHIRYYELSFNKFAGLKNSIVFVSRSMKVKASYVFIENTHFFFFFLLTQS